MDYRDHCVFTRMATDTGAGGQLVEGATTTIYDGKCDAQENDRRQDIAAGIETDRGSIRVFLPVSVGGLGLRENDRARITIGSDTREGRADRVDRTDDSCLVLYD